MSNPFITKFDSECAQCASLVPAGEDMFAHNGEFICTACAENNDNVCACGKYKKANFEVCFDCKESGLGGEDDGITEEEFYG